MAGGMGSRTTGRVDQAPLQFALSLLRFRFRTSHFDSVAMVMIAEQEFRGQYSSFIHAYTSARDGLLRSLAPDELTQPVIEWVTPSDLRFPRVLHHRSLASVLTLPAYDLVSLPGMSIARAKAVLKLLQAIPLRRSRDHLYSIPATAKAAGSLLHLPAPAAGGQWWNDACQVVIRHGLEREPLGKFCESLADLPEFLWEKPLGTYSRMMFSELKHERRVGTRRLRTITQVFQTLYSLLWATPPHPFLALHFIHAEVGEVERWVGSALRSDGMPEVGDLREKLIEPLLAQIGKDGGDDLKLLAFARVIHAKTLGELASGVGLTRERIRQRLRKVGRIMRVRWPEGRVLLDDLLDKASATPSTSAQAALLHNAFHLFYPIRRYQPLKATSETRNPC